jgi:hypothetical protein
MSSPTAGPCSNEVPAATASNSNAAEVRRGPDHGLSDEFVSSRNMAILLIKVSFAGRNALAGQHGGRPSCRSANRDRLRR